MLDVQIVSPERILYSGQASVVVCRTVEGGDIAFLTGHAPFIGALATWPAALVTETGERQVFAVHGGFVEVSADRVTILSDVAELGDQIDTARAQRALEAADAALRANADDEEAAAAAARARVRLEVDGAPAGASTSGAH